MTELGNYMRTARRARGYTSAEAARYAGIPVGYWEEFERGRFDGLRPDHLVEMATWFNYPAEKLYRMYKRDAGIEREADRKSPV